MRTDAHSLTGSDPALRWRSWPLWQKLLICAAATIAVWLPRTSSLDRFITPDENAWSGRAEHFRAALAEGNYAGTFQTEHPGVTTMWAGAAGRLLGAPAFSRGGLAGGDPTIAAGRFFAVLANSLALGLAFYFAWRLFGLVTALVGLLLIALYPFHMAHSRILHLDGMLSSFLLLSLLGYLSYLRGRRPVDLVISGAAAGLSWLTKSPGLFLIPLVALLVGLDLARCLRAEGRPALARLLWRAAWPLVLWFLCGAGIFVLLWPAMWVDPVGTATRVLAPALGHARGGHGDPVFFGGRIYPDGRIDASVWWFYPVAYLWRTTPLVLMGLLAAGVAFVWKVGPLDRPNARRAVAGLVTFALLYAVLMNLGAKKFDRYLLPAFAPLDLVAAVGWVALAGWVGRVVRSRFPDMVAVRAGVGLLLLGLIVLAQSALSLPARPYYLSYYNPLLGGGRRAPEVLMVGWGEGLDQAGRYLSARPDGHQLQVASWYVPCFAPFFSGVTRGIPLETELGDEQVRNLLGSDYLVIYAHQWQRQMPRDLLDRLSGEDPVLRVEINDLEYARVYAGSPSE